MALPSDFVSSLEFIPPRAILTMVGDGTWPEGGGTIELCNEVRPVDLFCYLGSRFGPPNGFQNFLREDDSDNLIHWEWTLRHPAGIASFQGMNFRTELHVHGNVQLVETDMAGIVSQLRKGFSSHGQGMGEIRRRLEHWTEFVNPYQRIRRAVEKLWTELDSLNLNPATERIDDPWTLLDREQAKTQWEDIAARYRKGFALCFAIRSMLPVLAESFVNLILFVLMRSEIRSDDRLRENTIRQPIDVRIKSLSLTCDGFMRQPDYANGACTKYHSLVNERNDLLHGNIAVDKLRFNEVYFWGKVPIFREYRSMWQRSLDIEMHAVGLLDMRNELAVVDNLVSYIQSCLKDDVRLEIEQIANQYELGINYQGRRIGILFSPRLSDMRAAPVPPPDVSSEA